MMDMFSNKRSDRKFARCESPGSTCEIISFNIPLGGSGGQEINNDPWDGVQDQLRELYAGTQSAFGNALPFYPNATYAPFNPLQIGGQYATLDYAQNRFQPGVGALQQGLSRNINQQMNPAATNPWANHYQAMFNQGDARNMRANNPYTGLLEGMANTGNTLARDPSLGTASAMTNIGQTIAQNPFNRNLQAMYNAPGQVASNPQLKAVMDQNRNAVTDTLTRDWLPQARSNAAMAGQYGGSKQGIAEGLAMGEASKALANANATSQMNAWNTAMGQQARAADLQNNVFSNALNQRSTGLQGLGNAYGNALNTQGSAANNLSNYVGQSLQQRTAGGQLMSNSFGQQLTGSLDAMRMMPNALQLGFMGPQYAMDIGGQQQNQYQRSIQEQMDRYYYPERRTWDMLSTMSGIYSGADPYASRSQSVPGNPLGTALGLGSLGASMFRNWNSGQTTPSAVPGASALPTINNQQYPMTAYGGGSQPYGFQPYDF